MSLRLIEIMTSTHLAESIITLLNDQPTHGVWLDSLPDGNAMLRVLASMEDTEAICDQLESRYGAAAGFRLMLLPVEATLPRVEQEADKAPEKAESEGRSASITLRTGRRISREELYDDLSEMAGPTTVHSIMVALSAVAAAIGLLKDSETIVIGAMVIAPLLGPNVAMALATTLADLNLARRAIRASLSGIVITLAGSFLVGAMVAIDPSSQALAARASIGFGDIVLALVAGAAGALAVTSGAPTVLIGVMVAVALMPPLVTSGLLIGSGQWGPAAGAGLLFLCNVVCVNLTGVVTFRTLGIRPRAWWEATRARRAATAAIAVWIGLLAIMIALIALSRTAFHA